MKEPVSFDPDTKKTTNIKWSVKDTTGITSSQIIADRMLQEGKILLKHSAWSVSEIAYALGFMEVTHFNNFFRKHTLLSLLNFRNI